MTIGTANCSETFTRTGALNRQALEHLMLHGERPEANMLPGWEYRGMNVGLMGRLLGIRKFVKGFVRAPGGEIHGYNLRARQNDLTAPWLTIPPGSEPARFGFYTVTPVQPTARENTYLHALLLDYGQGGNGRLNLTSAIRDYVVRVEPGSDDLLLGKAYIAIGRLRIPVGYFVLERFRRNDDAIAAKER